MSYQTPKDRETLMTLICFLGYLNYFRTEQNSHLKQVVKMLNFLIVAKLSL